MNKSNFSDNLKTNGLKITKHRIEILDILEKSNQPIAAEQLFQEMQEKNISINLSTVYRTLDILCDKNLLTKINIDDSNKTLYEINRMLHTHHLICLVCKKILTINGCPLEGYENSLAKETNYTIAGHKLDIYGYCPECRNKQLAGELNDRLSN
ncbi:MAG: transcriptional repressor [Clostridia bacterium]|nr:transcriptional repressor [Clostridia bacterium]